MAASGLTRYTCDKLEFSHVNAMIDYALELFQKVVNVNEHSFNNFRMRVGINIGPVVAGVIGSKKPQYGKRNCDFTLHFFHFLSSNFFRRYLGKCRECCESNGLDRNTRQHSSDRGSVRDCKGESIVQF